jgi:glycosyltransferase involved in cell wall biosynthesis
MSACSHKKNKLPEKQNRFPMQQPPTIAAIVPIYNAQDSIGQCIDSITSQSVPDIEIILVDDGSTDGSAAICRRKAEAATATWITYVDADDTLFPDALLRLSAQAEADTDIVLGGAESLAALPSGPIGMEAFRHMAVRGEGTIGKPWGSLFRRSCITAYLFDVPRELNVGEDYIFWLRLIFTTERPVRFLREQVYRKGPAHSSIRWTADYALFVDNFRIGSIPEPLRPTYMPDITSDRLTNLFAVAVDQPAARWKHSPFFRRTMADAETYGIGLPFKKRMFLHLPSRWLRLLYSRLGNLLLRLRSR